MSRVRSHEGRGCARRWIAAIVALAAAATAAAATSSHAAVLKVRVGGDSVTTRVVVELDAAVKGRLEPPAAGGSQAVIVLAHAAIAGPMSGRGEGLVERWSVDEADGGARIVLDLGRRSVVKRRFLLAPGDGLDVYRYVVDLEPLGPAARGRERVAATVEAAEPAPARLKVVVIDPGHGGKDPGAEGREDHEKDLTLAAAHQLRDRLQGRGRYQVVLTRDTDVFVPLQERVRIARRANADLFISLHADAGTEQGLHGATVYTMSEEGADRSARNLVGQANWFDVDLPGGDATVNRILLDLTQRDTRNRSSVFAELLLDRIGERVTLARRSHRDAGFMVLLAPDVPAVLLEMGFITNAEDETQMRDAERRERLMEGVVDGVDAYFAQERRIAAR